MNIRFQLTLLLLSALLSGILVAQDSTGSMGGLAYAFSGHYGQIEVGGPYAGVEFHGSRPLPSRISFYYPVANSIDLSTDYWKRGESMPMAIGLQIDDGRRRWVGREPWSYVVSPHKVVFTRVEGDWKISIQYEFCLHEPAFVRTIQVWNLSKEIHTVTLYTHIKPSLRTCQTYSRLDSARTAYDSELNTAKVDFDEETADKASVFVEDVEQKPERIVLDSYQLGATDSGTSNWVSDPGIFAEKKIGDRKHAALVASEYRKTLGSKEFMEVVQITGSCRRDEVVQVAKRVQTSWEDEVAMYDMYVTSRALGENYFKTGDSSVDASAVWARALLTTNAHYIDSQVVPMPCPAEYNFFFSHDVLMTDLAAVNFDLKRVKKDLLYIASHAQDSIIPHAYYWRDDGYKTEYCTPDNWNHFWFILASAAYLRHSFDSVTVSELYPLLTKSLHEVLSQVKSDHLMHAYRPDWWDIGHLEGARAYTTILTIRSLREYLFISSLLRRAGEDLPAYELLADSMQVALTEKLWDPGAGYLMNYNGATKDTHFYMGSLLSVVYGLLDRENAETLLRTAGGELVDTNLGVRTVMPPDFGTSASISYYKFAGEEAGRPYLYINGGVWPHDNAWYALALNSMSRPDDALAFLKRTMTLDGIVHSPNGEPAMYEYRFADPGSKDYGMVDKPSFLWAGGFYLKTLYGLYGLRENIWNISVNGTIPSTTVAPNFTLEFGSKKNVTINSRGKYLRSLLCGNEKIPATVLPMNSDSASRVVAEFDTIRSPYLYSIDAIVRSMRWKSSRVLECSITSFRGHHVSAVIATPVDLESLLVDGIPVDGIRPYHSVDGGDGYQFSFVASQRDQKLEISFREDHEGSNLH